MNAQAAAESTELTAPDIVEAPIENPPEIKVEPIVEKAKGIGWRPKEDWSGDPDEWVDAAEFVRRKPLFDRLHKQERALREKEARLEAVSQHAAKVEKLTRERTIAELEAKRLNAVEIGDTTAFKHVDEQIREIQKEIIPEPPKNPPILPEVEEFTKRNKWFESDEDMTDYAMARARKYADQGIALKDSLPQVEKDIRRAFPHKFANPNKEKPAAVGSGQSEVRAKSFGYNSLDDGQKAVWATLKNSGMTLEKYINDLKELGELK